MESKALLLSSKRDWFHREAVGFSHASTSSNLEFISRYWVGQSVFSQT